VIRRAVVFFFLLVGAVQAQNAALPAYYDVTGVASNDALNVRAAPEADAQILGTLAFDATNVAVVTLSGDRRWAMVGAGEGSGWVALRYLARQDGQEDALPAGLICSGTEPFWALMIDDTRAEFSMPDAPPIELRVGQSLSAMGYSGRYGLLLEGQDLGATAIIRREMCSDGMSDRTYGFGVDLMVGSSASNALYAGCCRLER